MITRKDLAPLNDSDFEFWENNLKHRQDKTLWALYGFCQDFFTWSCPKDYLGCTCDGCLNQEIYINYVDNIVICSTYSKFLERS